MYKIAGEQTPFVMHVAARALATHALSIFGDHSDVMAARQTGWAMLCSQDVQEAQDFALISTQASLASRIPFLHFFDGFRTSHEVMKIEQLTMDDMREMIDDDLVSVFVDQIFFQHAGEQNAGAAGGIPECGDGCILRIIDHARI